MFFQEIDFFTLIMYPVMSYLLKTVLVGKLIHISFSLTF